MAEKLGEAVLELRTDQVGLDRGIKDAEGKAAALSQRFDAFGQRAMAAGGRLSLAITAPLALLAKQSIDASRQQEKAVASVEAALGSMGDRAGFTSQQLQAMASELQANSLFGDEAILQQVTANLLTFGNIAGDAFDRAQQAAVDLSARLGTDLQSSTVMLGKALNDPITGITALTRVGVSFTEQQKEQIKAMAEAGDVAGAQAMILAELENQYGGQAAAAAAADGGVTQLANSWGDFQEQIGSVLIQLLQPLIGGLGDLVSWLQSLDENTRQWVVGIGLAAAALGPVLVVIGLMSSGIGALIPLFTGLVPLFAGLGIAAGPLVAIVAGIAAAGFLIYQNWDKISPVLESVYARFQEVLGPRIQELIATVQRVLTELWQGPLGEMIGTVIGVLSDFQMAYLQVLGEVLLRVLSGALEMVTAVFDQIGNILNFIGALLTGDFAGAWAAMEAMVDTAVNGLLNVVAAVFPEALEYVIALYNGVKTWLQDKLGAVFDSVGKKVQQVTGFFRDMYIAVVGNSYVPDMVDELAEEAKRFGQTFVDPMLAGVGEITDAFAGIESPSLEPAEMPTLGEGGMAEDFRKSFSDGIQAAMRGDLGGFLDRTFSSIMSNAMRSAADVLSETLSGLFGGGSGGGGGLGGVLGSLLGSFAGGRATGGVIPSGSFGIVGERGPEIAVATPGGMGIMSNRDSRVLMGEGGGGTSISIPISIDATGADAAALARTNAKLEQLRAELPGTIISAVQDASDRRILNLKGGR